MNTYKCNYLEFISIVTKQVINWEEEEGHPSLK